MPWIYWPQLPVSVGHRLLHKRPLGAAGCPLNEIQFLLLERYLMARGSAPETAQGIAEPEVSRFWNCAVCGVWAQTDSDGNVSDHFSTYELPRQR